MRVRSDTEGEVREMGIVREIGIVHVYMAFNQVERN
jgi:hypothetical protein